jgi:hypothetical protein
MSVASVDVVQDMKTKMAGGKIKNVGITGLVDDDHHYNSTVIFMTDIDAM